MRGIAQLAARRRWRWSARRSAASTPPTSPSRPAAGRCCSTRRSHPARDLASTSASRRLARPGASSFYFQPRLHRRTARAGRRPARPARACLRDHRQGRRGARLARDVGALSGQPHQAARRQRPCAVGFRARVIWTRCSPSSIPPEPRGAPAESLGRARAVHGTIRAHVCIVRRSRQVPGGRVLSEAEASAQVELDTGKRVKVKARQHPAAIREARARPS